MSNSSIPEYRGQFTLGARLEASGPISLYRGQDARTFRPVTITIVAAPFDPGLEPRLLAEAALRHENIVPIVSLSKSDDQIFIVREPLTDALPLPEFIRQQSPALTQRIEIMIQVAKALAFAQADGVLHRDLTPARVFVMPDGSAHVTDFSLDRGHPTDVLGSIFDYGAIFRELIARAPECPAALADLAEKATNPDPSSRYQSFDAIVRDAEAGLRQFRALNALLDRARASMAAQHFSAAIQDLQSAAKLAPLDMTMLDQALRGLHGESPKPADRWDENVQFTVYRPQVVRPGEWKTLLAFAHLSERPPGAPDPLEEVRRRAGRMLGSEADQYQDLRQDSSTPIPAEGELTFVPQMNGVEFNPPRVNFLWEESVHQATFRLRANPQIDGSMARGQMCVYLGSILVAQIALQIEVNGARPPRAAEDPLIPASAPRYRKIFASYSHRDAPVVQEFERYGKAMGDEYLRDVIHLRSGEVWNDRLLQMIEEADVFQLFWSSHSMRSEYVRREWQYALQLKRECFVRPVYWEDPLPESPDHSLPPEDLRTLHFHRVFPGVAPAALAVELDRVPPTVPYVAPPQAILPQPIAPPPIAPRLADIATTPLPPRKSSATSYRWAAAAAMVVMVAGVGYLGLGGYGARPRPPITVAQNPPEPLPSVQSQPAPEPQPAPPEPQPQPSPPRRERVPAPTATPPQPVPAAGNYRLVLWSRGSAVGEGQILAGGDPQLQCFVLGAASSRSSILVRWFREGMLTGEMNFQGAAVAKAYRGPTSPGEYRAVLIVDGRELARVNFSIEARAGPVN